MGLASFNRMRIRQVEQMKPENIIKKQQEQKQEIPIINKQQQNKGKSKDK